ncbi:hypothetical protein CC86DRAFT_412116 [Ophiobolus disseminans]|uniref:C2H2-type domain-containing protein n=1 Tax=Ophiobolus disseminans TaxID=1469910 RepID=A0A6A6ZJ04_9PLEO|nr:hypothetical protein CC86DRAFT_412116 [Ophiobolus disseminans]
MDDIPIAPTAQTARLFLFSCQELLIEDRDIHRIATTQLNRFDLWASNIGIFASKHSSLDYRLRTAPTAKAAVDGNLEILCKHALGALAGRMTLTDNELDAFADLSLQDIPAFAIKFNRQNLSLVTKDTRDVQLSLLKGVDKSIGVLHRFSLAIRKASNRHTIVRTPQLLAFDEGYHWGRSAQDLVSTSVVVVDPISFDVTKIFEDFVYRCCLKRYQEVMLQRCVAAISARRRQLTYFQKHEAKLANARAGGRAPDTCSGATPKSQNDQHANNLMVPIGSHSLIKPFATGGPSQAFDMTLGDTVPSVFKVESFRPPPSTSAPSSTNPGSSAGGLVLAGPFDISPAPEIARMEKEKMCPYCCIVYQSRVFSTKQRSGKWRKHLLEDIQPYICVYEKCEQLGTTYRTFKVWQAHLKKAHIQE